MAHFFGQTRKNRAIRSNPADFASQNPQGFPLLSLARTSSNPAGIATSPLRAQGI
jgi:hypothetical protein